MVAWSKFLSGFTRPSILLHIAAVVLTLITLHALFHSTFFPLHDFTHAARLEELHRALQDGEFPVRWSRNFGFGYGMPLFNFYGPLPYYVMEIPHALGVSAIDSIKIFLFVLTLFSFYGVYRYVSSIWGAWSGFLAGAAWLFIPYRALDLFVRGAFNELVAISFVPWCLFCIEEILQKATFKNVLGLTCSLAGILLSHNIMTLMFLPVLAVYAAVRWITVQSKASTGLKLVLAFIVGLCLSAFYVFPAFAEKNLTQVDRLTQGYSNYTYHFLYIRQFFIGKWGYGGSILGPEDDISFQIGWVHVVLAAMGGIALLKRKKREKTILALSLLFIGVSAYMTLFKSQWIWDRVSLLTYVQFPWRFLSVIVVFVPILCGASVLSIPKRWQRLFVCFATLALIVMNVSFFVPREYLKNNDDMYYTDAYKIRRAMSEILPDYIPKTMPSFAQPVDERYMFSPSVKTQKTIIDRTHELLIEYETSQPSFLTLHIAYFPNWTVYIDGKKWDFTVDPKKGNMVMNAVPTGTHIVSAKFEDTQIRLVSNALSVGALVFCIGVLFYDRTSRD